jgi:hypothetical protein
MKHNYPLSFRTRENERDGEDGQLQQFSQYFNDDRATCFGLIKSHYQAPFIIYGRNTCNNMLLNIIEIEFLHARNLYIFI